MSTDNGAWHKCDQQTGQSDNSSICNFKPDLDYSTPRAQQWKADSDVQRTKPLDLNENGEYKVKWGDCLSTIAERALKDSGQAVNRDSLQSMQDAIVQANHDRYKTLDCNTGFVKENWCLKIPGSQQEQTPTKVEPPIKVEPLPPVQQEPLPPVDQPQPRHCPQGDRRMPDDEPQYRRPYPQDMGYPRGGIINEPGGVINIFLNGLMRNQNRDYDRNDRYDRYDRGRDYDQRWNPNTDMPREFYRPLPYRRDFDYQPYSSEQPRHCSPCEQRQYYHNLRMPQVLRRNPVYPRY